MKTITLERIDNSIKQNKKSANLTIRLSSLPVRKKKTRTRAKGEIVALDQIAISRWKKAIQQGKIKSLGERVLYYDYND